MLPIFIVLNAQLETLSDLVDHLASDVRTMEERVAARVEARVLARLASLAAGSSCCDTCGASLGTR